MTATNPPTVECRDFYVYIHEDADGVPFYVGKGRGLRAYSRADRNKAWRDAAGPDRAFTVKIVRVGLTDGEARDLETATIKEIGRTCDGGTLVNVNFSDKSFHWREYYVTEDLQEIVEQAIREADGL